MKQSIFLSFCISALVISFLLLAPESTIAQSYDRLERGRMKDILNIVKSEVKKNYYDPEYHGIDLEARFQKAEDRLAQALRLHRLSP